MGAELQQQTTTAPVARRPRLAYKTRYRLWLALWLGLVVFFFSGVQLSLGPVQIRTIALDWGFIGEWWPFISRGVLTTIRLAAFAIVGATVLALTSALAGISGVAPAASLAGLYISLFRGTPLFLQMFIVYFGLAQVGLVFDGFTAAVIVLSLNYGAYMSEIFRAGIQAVSRGQIEAAAALGMTPAQIMRRIVLPQAVRIITPDIGNQFIAMQKDTSLASAITVTELAGRARQAGSPNNRFFEALIVAAVWYWVMTLIFSFFQERLERRMARSDR
ncbi:MAG TPA: amino acid ABC transporter permease [Chloroflexaceae bacterium]|nr:amino acid ABC transporter permease [Chloroflexaceae bacterium]